MEILSQRNLDRFYHKGVRTICYVASNIWSSTAAL